MRRKMFERDGVALSYLDAGGSGRPVVALHDCAMEAGTWTDFAASLAPRWRVIALDQRGHGLSDKPADMSWNALISDLDGFIGHLGLYEPVFLVGHGLGGLVSYRFAAHYSARVAGMVVEEAPAVLQHDLNYLRGWEGVYPTREALAAKIGGRLAGAAEASLRKVGKGWTLAFSPAQLADAHQRLHGSFWRDWTSSTCPALVVRGLQSAVVEGAMLELMAKRRPNTQISRIAAGSIVHHDAPEAFAAAVTSFLDDALVQAQMHAYRPAARSIMRT